MKYLPLVWRNLLRRKIRTTFTLLSIFVAFLLFAFLMTIRTAFSMGVEVAGVDRLMMMHKVSLIQLLPISYMRDIQSTPGVTLVSHNTWFGGTYQDKANQFAVIAVDPEPYLKLYPEFKVAPDQQKAWLADRQGVLVGRDVATRYGWKVGDKIPIQGTIWLPKQGSTWFFNIDAIYDGAESIDKTNVFFRYDYLDENRRGAYGQVGWYIIKIEDGSQAAAMISKLDGQFANSAAETKTSTEKAFLQGFVNQIGDVGAMMVAILVAVLFSILLVTANTMSQAVRERTNELAVLKTLGFSNGLVLVLVLAESLFMAILGGGAALALAWIFISRGSLNNAFLPVFVLRGRDVALGVVLSAVLGSLAGALPAVSAMRLRVTDALRRN
jgi:putative ABC transport system permease protein